MKSVRGVCLIVLFIFLGVFSSSSLAQGAKTSPGQEVFKSKCTLCHGTDGSGKTTLGQQMKASDLHSVEVQKQTDAELKDIISRGKGNMPGFQAQLSDDELGQVLAYVRQLGKKTKAVAQPMKK